MDKEGGFINRPPILDGSNYDYWKLEEDWSKEEDEPALGNSKALNALFNGVDKNIFRLINTYTITKDALEILRTTHEGISKVKMYRLQLLTIRFENLKMKDDDNVHEFYMSILEIDNSSSALGEKMSKEKQVRKILRSLPKKFDMKVTTIEEAQEINTMRVHELIGSLQTFELGISDKSKKKSKSITFVSDTKDEEDQCDLDTDEGMTNAIVLLGRQFYKKRTRSEERFNQGKGIQCHGYEGFGHIRAKCPTYLKKQKKGLSVSWSDYDNSESESKDEVVKHVTDLTGRYESDEDSCDEEVSYEEPGASYEELRIKSEEAIIMMNKGSNVLDEVLQVGKVVGDLRGIDFNYQNLEKEEESSITKFVLPKREPELVMSKHLTQHSASHQNTQMGGKYPSQPMANQMATNTRNEWIPKPVNTSLIAHTSLRASAREDWHFNIGCSRHMTSIKKFLENIKSYSTSYVTAGDGDKGEIKGVGRLACTGHLSPDNVMLVKGLTTNLISISQLCDEGIKGKF
ncbi:uncharacterized protein LOC127137667 [Lathyrus oleraceus]|uniref:uncharacterized protein LOC127137667 n=1 Tax=Pisum sativum TaxID=3888 RepID=UPI0021CFEF3F|nr:uncharacterized protein LOC127137667 [Pisum sativum]